MNIQSLAEFFKKSGLRKVASGLYMFTLTCGLAYVRAIDGEVFKAVAVVIAGALMGGNALEHFANKGQAQ